MIKQTYLRAMFSLCLLVLFASCHGRGLQVNGIPGSPSPSSVAEKAPTVSFCDLIGDPTRFEQNIVRTQATLFRNMENAALYDRKCEGRDMYVWLEFDPAYADSDEQVKQRLEQALCPSQPCKEAGHA